MGPKKCGWGELLKIDKPGFFDDWKNPTHMSSLPAKLARCGQPSPAVLDDGATKAPAGSEEVYVMCGGVVCTRKKRSQLWAVRGVLERTFRDGSPFMGSVVTWDKDHWVWSVQEATREDMAAVRRVLGLACGPTGVDAFALEPERVRHFASIWGILNSR